MSHLYESDDESAGETCYNPVAKFFVSQCLISF